MCVVEDTQPRSEGSLHRGTTHPITPGTTSPVITTRRRLWFRAWLRPRPKACSMSSCWRPQHRGNRRRSRRRSRVVASHPVGRIDDGSPPPAAPGRGTGRAIELVYVGGHSCTASDELLGRPPELVVAQLRSGLTGPRAQAPGDVGWSDLAASRPVHRRPYASSARSTATQATCVRRPPGPDRTAPLSTGTLMAPVAGLRTGGIAGKRALRGARRLRRSQRTTAGPRPPGLRRSGRG